MPHCGRRKESHLLPVSRYLELQVRTASTHNVDCLSRYERTDSDNGPALDAGLTHEVAEQKAGKRVYPEFDVDPENYTGVRDCLP